jgi:hypothetical protein
MGLVQKTPKTLGQKNFHILQLLILFTNFMEKKLMNLVRIFPKEIKREKGQKIKIKILCANLPLSHLQGNHVVMKLDNGGSQLHWWLWMNGVCIEMKHFFFIVFLSHRDLGWLTMY